VEEVEASIRECDGATGCAVGPDKVNEVGLRYDSSHPA
jgi:hypothetical protein